MSICPLPVRASEPVFRGGVRFGCREVFAIGAMLALLSGISEAQTVGQGTGLLSRPITLNIGVLLVSTTTAATGQPACVTTAGGRFAVDGTTEAGKVMVASILAAYAQGKQVTIVGTGDCGVYGNSETIAQLRVSD